MILRIITFGLIVLFPVSEIVLTLFKRSRSGRTDSRDRGTMLLVWLGVAVGVGAAMMVQNVRATHLSVSGPGLEIAGDAVMLAGLVLRWWSIAVLGRYFTTDVAVQERQPVIRTGPYRLVRHPAYAGTLVTFAGLGLVMSNWLSIVALLVPILLAMLNRIVVEERALVAALGEPYSRYCAETKRLVPGIY